LSGPGAAFQNREPSTVERSWAGENPITGKGGELTLATAKKKAPVKKKTAAKKTAKKK
jgi:hypothetical protein